VSQPTLVEIMGALAAQLRTALASALPDLQVDARLNPNPTPPSVDIYPADPFLEHSAFGIPNREASFLIRARVAGDHEAQQDELIGLMDVNSTTSLAAALGNELAVNGDTFHVSVNGPSGFRQYTDPGGNSLLGCEWTVQVPL